MLSYSPFTSGSPQVSEDDGAPQLHCLLQVLADAVRPVRPLCSLGCQDIDLGMQDERPAGSCSAPHKLVALSFRACCRWLRMQCGLWGTCAAWGAKTSSSAPRTRDARTPSSSTECWQPSSRPAPPQSTSLTRQVRGSSPRCKNGARDCYPHTCMPCSKRWPADSPQSPLRAECWQQSSRLAPSQSKTPSATGGHVCQRSGCLCSETPS